MKNVWTRRAVMAIVAVVAGAPACLPWAGRAWAQGPGAGAFDGAVGIRTKDAELAKRLGVLCEKLERKRVEQHIPGMSIAVVKDGQIVLARGFGLRDMDAGAAADEKTVYAIGSQTKAFTCMLVSMLADEGRLSWDAPVRQYVPGFALFDKAADAEVKIRDLCCHRTGLPRTDLLWASGKASKQQMMERLAFAEPTAKFRGQWQYNNTMLMVAGMAAGNAAGSTWPELIRTRIFEPLGMKDSSTHISVMQKNPRAALGYKWDEDAKEHKHLPMREITCDGAGAINSTVLDMSRWLVFQTGRGEIDGTRLVSEKMVEEMWTPQIDMGPGGMKYGLGWMLHDWQGKRVVEHGGNIDGFFTACGMLPDERVGVVLMGTLTYSGLQGEVLPMTWEAIFPPAASAEGGMSEAELAGYVGKYRVEVIGVDSTVNIKDGKLCMDVPGQMNYELKWPDKDGKWAFAIAPDAIQVKFVKNAKGEIESVTMYQGGAELECPRLGTDGTPLVKEVAPFTREQLTEFTGTYHFTPADQDWKVVVKKGRLAVDVPKQRVFDLKWPDKDGKWKVAILQAWCSFNRNAAGKIESMTWYQNGELVMPRVGEGEVSDLPTVEQVSELRRRHSDPEKLKAMGDIQVDGKVRFVNQGVEGTVRGLANADGRSMQDIEFGVFGYIRASYDGTRAWSDSVGEEFTELTGERLAEAKSAGSQFVINDLKVLFDTVEVVERSTLDGKDVIVVSGHTEKPDKTVKQYVDASTGLPLKEETSTLIPGLGRLPITVTYGDYKDVEGVQIPMKIRMQNEATGAMEFVLEKVTTRAKVGPGAYELKPAAK